MENQVNGFLTESIECTCPNCKTLILYPMEKDGQKVKCPKCRAVFAVEVEQPIPSVSAQSIQLDHPILDGFLLGLGMSLAAALVGTVVWLLAYAIGSPFTTKNRTVDIFQRSEQVTKGNEAIRPLTSIA